MADINAESIQQRIQIARRDAEALKDRIKRKKDELADTTCTCPRRRLCRAEVRALRVLTYQSSTESCSMLTIPMQCVKSPGNGSTSYPD